jgi:hypothetical protein
MHLRGRWHSPGRSGRTVHSCPPASSGQRPSVSRAQTLHSPRGRPAPSASADRRSQRARRSSLLAYRFVRRGSQLACGSGRWPPRSGSPACPRGPTASMVTGPSFTSAAAGARAGPGQDSTRGPASASRGSRLRGARVWSRCSASALGPLVMVSAPCRGSARHGPMSRRAGPSAPRLSCCLAADVAGRRVRWAARSSSLPW